MTRLVRSHSSSGSGEGWGRPKGEDEVRVAIERKTGRLPAGVMAVAGDREVFTGARDVCDKERNQRTVTAFHLQRLIETSKST